MLLMIYRSLVTRLKSTMYISKQKVRVYSMFAGRRNQKEVAGIFQLSQEMTWRRHGSGFVQTERPAAPFSTRPQLVQM